MIPMELRRESLKMALEVKLSLRTIDEVILVADKIYQYLSGLQNNRIESV
jgi:hypothetical protein